jgi:biopolymer transport protein TolR
MNRRRFRGALRHDINVAPLVDVMLVLLVVFMTTAPMMNGALKVSLPKENAGKGAESQAISVVIDRGGQLFLYDHPVNAQQLVKRLRALPTSIKENISIHADRQLSYEVVMKTMALLAKEGFLKLNLVVEGTS